MLNQLPPPPPGRTGWPWTVAPAPISPQRPDGREWPRITIVTPSYNQGQYIEETIRSVLLQGYPNLEYLVMDGGSTDETVAIIEKYAPWIDHWQSQKDGGQADAINQGLEMATGYWFQNINSDDVLLEGALTRVGAADPCADMICGDVIEFGSSSDYTVRNTPVSLKQMLVQRWRTNEISWHQPGVFLRADRMRMLGGYDAELQYTFDFHFTCRYLDHYQTRAFVDGPLVRFRIHEAAKSSAWGDVFLRESIRAREQLANELHDRSLRKIAGREAARLQLFSVLREMMQSPRPEAYVGKVLPVLRKEPALFSERMLLGSIARKPLSWLKGIVA